MHRPRYGLIAATVALTATLTGLANASANDGPATKQDRTAERATQSTPTAYFVDPTAGSDTNDGTTQNRPWKTLDRLDNLTLPAGTTVHLRSATTHRGSLSVVSSGTKGKPIRVQPYGAGAAPILTGTDCLVLTGSYIEVRGVHTTDCGRAGIQVEGDNNTVIEVESSRNVAGVWVRPGADGTLVTSSWIHDNNLMAPNTPGDDDDYGAFGVEVNGNNTRVVDNRFAGHIAISADYGRDGAAIEVFQARNTLMKGNTSTDDLAFTELGGHTSTKTRVIGNTVASNLGEATFLMTRGPGQHWGPVTDTRAKKNTVTLTGDGSFGFGCYGKCTPQHLELKRNSISAVHYIGYVDGTFTTENNLYERGELWFKLGPGDIWEPR